MEWQPIETAPKDGSAVWLLTKPYSMNHPDGGGVIAHVPARAAVGYWDKDGTSWVDDCGSNDGDAYTLAKTGVWYSSSGWFEPGEVTHWMPLPEPPK